MSAHNLQSSAVVQLGATEGLEAGFQGQDWRLAAVPARATARCQGEEDERQVREQRLSLGTCWYVFSCSSSLTVHRHCLLHPLAHEAAVLDCVHLASLILGLLGLRDTQGSDHSLYMHWKTLLYG